MNRVQKTLVLISTVAVLGPGCTGDPIADRLPGVYRIDIGQGNIVTQEMIDELEPGMDERQVLFALGTPMLVDTFNPDRWDYWYSLRKGNGDYERRLITVWFEDQRLAAIDGPYRPNPADAAARPAGETIVEVPVRTEEKKNIFRRFWDWIRP